MGKKLTQEEFINRSKEKYGNKYDFSKVKYVNIKTPVTIICSEHGDFSQRPDSFLKGYACKYCSGHRLSDEEFIKRAKKIHGNKYDYSKVKIIDTRSYVCIICPEHGEFLQTPDNHLHGYGCKTCAGLKKLTNEEFIEKAKEIHGDKYDYSKVEYINNKTPVTIICSKHGEFQQTPNGHLQGKGCSKCHEENRKFYKLLNKEEFILKARQIHGWKYDYSKVEYKGSQKKVCIICPKHGEFWQTPANHLRYKGCKRCNASHLQSKIRQYLQSNSIVFEEEKILEFFRNGKSHLSVDFYLPEYNIAIECQGIQHFVPTNFGGKLTEEEMNENFEKQVINDKRKKTLCEENDVKLIYINYNNVNDDMKKLLRAIKKTQ